MSLLHHWYSTGPNATSTSNTKETNVKEQADLVVHQPTRIWVMREADVPEGVSTVVPTQVDGIVIVFAPVKEGATDERLKQVH